MLLLSQVAVNSDGSAPDNSAMLDVQSSNRGLLPPRMTSEELSAIVSPADGLLVFCVDCGSNGTGSLTIFMAGEWYTLNASSMANSAWACEDSITVNHVAGNVAPVNKTVTYGTITNIPGEPTKCWITSNLGADHQATAVDDATEASAGWYWQFNRMQGYKHDGTTRTPNTTWISSIDEDSDWLAANDPCALELGDGWRLPVASEWTNVIIANGGWPNWNAAWNSDLRLHAAGYLWNSLYERGSLGQYWSGSQGSNINGRGIWLASDGGDIGIMDKTSGNTIRCVQDSETPACGDPITINHVTGNVAPVDKTVTYGTITNIPGEPTKCWITSNLGASQQATAVDDATEASAGWYWQFNRMQGYKHDGTTRTPNTTWINSIDEDSDWLPANDPCSIELGVGWRLPTETEWTNVDASGGWTDWNGPWNSDLKMHAAGGLLYSDGSLIYRGMYGVYWSSTQLENTYGWYLFFTSGDCYMDYGPKAFGFTVRCINEMTAAPPEAPSEGTHLPSLDQIIWNWNLVEGATGYKWGATNDYESAEDMGVSVSKTETGLTCGTAYTRYAWAYNASGNSVPVTLTASTLGCTLACGDPFIINHVAGNVAPVNKTVTYGTVTNIPGEPTKCWITSNLGADHQATALDDATEASAGWYWQFNRQQGYKHDGITRTPNTTWISTISENSDWLSVNDPCTIELGSGWRLPTNTEYGNIKNAGSWTNWNGPWNSDLKMHAAGYLTSGTGSLLSIGSHGHYWSSMQSISSDGILLNFYSGDCGMHLNVKAGGMTVRCLGD